MRPTTRRPTRLCSVAALAAALVCVGAVGPYGGLGTAFAGLGVLALAAGLGVNSRPLVTLGPLALFVGAVVAGARDAPVLATLLAIVAAVLAYDFAATGIDIGAQLGREADTRRLELVRLGTSSFVGVATGGVSYLVYVLGTGGRPLSAVVAMLLAVIILFVALRRQTPTG
ncbi:hypothetical protein GRX03_05765 [Halovenus sp. WSH3]|uniref:Uncharacterized protein n=1 Tax=Halovenus carboxidivorans TaxID=2692199 RepID=A0A6B0SZK4_9EURY|nr:hypothetical protein [Halovenus carboxidivorans]MXR51114.1 hypothetical protein [Halovenus carboxidivorans]